MSSVFALPVAGQPVRHGDRVPADGRRKITLRSFVGDDENPLLESLAGGRPLASELMTPLVLFGRSGVGKTHLALALAQSWKAQRPHARVAYLTGADWLRRYPAQELDTDEATTSDASAGPGLAHPPPPRSSSTLVAMAGLLVLDDVDHLRDSAPAQHALSRSLDERVAEQSPVIVTAKVHPATIAEFSPGLRSRLTGGLTVAVQPPGVAARRWIVRELVATRGAMLPPELVDEVARRPGTVPEMLGRLHRLDLAAKMHGGPLDACLMERILSIDEPRSSVSLAQLAAATARQFGVRVEDLTGPRRQRALVTARNVFAMLARELLGTSYAQIGKYLGGRDHSTVMHSYAQIAETIRHDPTVAAAVRELRITLHGG